MSYHAQTTQHVYGQVFDSANSLHVAIMEHVGMSKPIIIGIQQVVHGPMPRIVLARFDFNQ